MDKTEFECGRLTGYCPKRPQVHCLSVVFFGNLNHCTCVRELNPLKYNINEGGNFMLLLDRFSRDLAGNEEREKDGVDANQG